MNEKLKKRIFQVYGMILEETDKDWAESQLKDMLQRVIPDTTNTVEHIAGEDLYISGEVNQRTYSDKELNTSDIDDVLLRSVSIALLEFMPDKIMLAFDKNSEFHHLYWIAKGVYYNAVITFTHRV